MANSAKVTVEKAYFDALLRRADFHTSTQLLGHHDPANVSISRVEYNSLLRISREYELLKNALFQGGIAAETLDLLVSGAQGNDLRNNESCFESADLWTQDWRPKSGADAAKQYQQNGSAAHLHASGRASPGPTAFSLPNRHGALQNGHSQQPSSHLRVPTFQRQASYGMSSVPEDVAFDDDESLDEGNQLTTDFSGIVGADERRTIYLSGFSERTTYRDLLSAIKGGKLLSVNLRSERSATVTFFDGAADFYTWAKRNDIYLNAKRLEVKWADRQYRLNGHIAHKITNGATRNVVIHSAVDKGLTESTIRADMEHIHNLVIIDIKYRSGDAYVSTNSVHNALFARTCMMSRSTYKGCKIEFFRDECDVPLPARTSAPKAAATSVSAAQQAAKNKKQKPPVMMGNRFDMLNLDAVDGSSDEENRTPSDHDTDDTDVQRNVGVSLNFLESESA